MLELASAYLMRFIFNVLYLPLWVFPIKKDKMSIFSRQSSTPSIDIQLLTDEIRRRDPNVKIKVMVRRDNGGVKGTVSMLGVYLKSLYHMATSKVCVLESYWPPLSICKKRAGTVVVQMWHSIGKVKQSGIVAAGKPGGRPKRLSQAMRMHKGYDFIIAGADSWNKFYMESFDCGEDVLRNVGLPRIDHLVNDKEETAKKVIDAHNFLEGKRVILYAPTFRRGGKEIAEDLLGKLDELDKSEFAVVVKAHPNQAIDCSGHGFEKCDDISTMDLLSVSEYLITDYSAIALEGAAADVKTLYYVPDYEEYEKETGLNIDLFKEMPGCVFKDASEVIDALKTPYPVATLDSYKQRFIFKGVGGSASAIADVIFDEAGLAR